MRVERLAVHEFEDEKARALEFFDPIDARDVRVIESGQRVRLPLETGNAVGIARERVGENLDRDVAPKLRVMGPIETSPMPPAPSGATMSYVPSEAPPGSAKAGVF